MKATLLGSALQALSRKGWPQAARTAQVIFMNLEAMT